MTSSGRPSSEPDSTSRDTSDEEDVRLMLAAAADDMEAFAALVRKHEKQLMNFFVRCGVSTDVEDLAQLTFLKIHKVRRRYHPAAKFTTFLYLIARQIMLDRFRSESRKTALHERAGREMAAAVEAPVARGEKDDARFALSKLSPGLAAAVVLVVMQGFEYHEAAEILQIPVGTVKSRVHAALSQMRKTLQDGPEKSRLLP